MTVINLKTGERTRRVTEKIAAALGSFDGVHMGHRAVIGTAKRAAARLGAKSAAWCVVPGEKSKNGLLTTTEEKIILFKGLGLDYAVIEDFEAVRDLSCEEFVFSYLKKINCLGAFCGFNFKFGKGAACGCEKLSELCGAAGIACEASPAVSACGKTVSSTLIRSLVENGRVDEARDFLGDFYFAVSKVSHGRGLGGALGFPTMNQSADKIKVLPRNGVYFTLCDIDGARHAGVTNVGTRPTVNGHERRLETHVLGLDGDLYGKAPTVRFVKFSRPEVKFPSKEELCRAVMRDVEAAEEFFSKFDFDGGKFL